jgi:hypothetical protein
VTLTNSAAPQNTALLSLLTSYNDPGNAMQCICKSSSTGASTPTRMLNSTNFAALLSLLTSYNELNAMHSFLIVHAACILIFIKLPN